MVGSLPFDGKKGCPDGFHKRASYTTKKGHHVSRRCVKAQSVYNESSKDYTRRLEHRQENRLRTAHHSRTRKLHCPPGKIERKAYVRRFTESVMKRGYTIKRADGKEYHVKPAKKSVYVKPMCIKDRGDPSKKAPGPGHGIGLLRKGELSKYGYVYLKHREERHRALRRAIKEYGSLGVYHKLDAISKLSKYTVPRASRIFQEDLEWVKHHYELKAP
jgi:hypothetical protein